jgi:hypothetical protein
VNINPIAERGMEEAMHDHHIDSMVRRLKPVLKDAAKVEAILKRYWHARMALV